MKTNSVLKKATVIENESKIERQWAIIQNHRELPQLWHFDLMSALKGALGSQLFCIYRGHMVIVEDSKLSPLLEQIARNLALECADGWDISPDLLNWLKKGGELSLELYETAKTKPGTIQPPEAKEVARAACSQSLYGWVGTFHEVTTHYLREGDSRKNNFAKKQLKNKEELIDYLTHRFLTC